MRTCTFPEARAVVLEAVTGRPGVEHVPLEACAGRVLAEVARADRDYPPADRSIRDGYAVVSASVPGRVRVIGEVRAGDRFPGEVRPGEAVEIMTGAPMPRGADAVVMVEHTIADDGFVSTERSSRPGEFVNFQGSEARAGDVLIEPGVRLDYSHAALLATVGVASVAVYAKPRVAILATGDEIVPVAETPREFQIRNSNVYSLAAQVIRAGGVPQLLPVAPDRLDETRWLIEKGLESDLLLLSGGVSAGKYDLVETVLAGLGAEFLFDRVLIQPGQPLVFGRVPAVDRFFFGLPGNPASTMVTFEIFARAAVERLAGQTYPALPLTSAPLTRDFRHKTGLTRFLPANLGDDGGLTPVPWQGSSDVPAIARANCYLVAHAGRAEWKAGDWMQVLRK